MGATSEAMLSHRGALGCVLLALASSGCSASVAPIEVAPGCPDGPARGSAPAQAAADEDLIDDFEHEGNALPRRGDRNGTWALGFGSDGSAEVEAGGSDQCAFRGGRAGHFTGSGLSSRGPNWTAVLRSQTGGGAQSIDASAYAAVSFWAAAGPGVATPYALQVGVTTPAPNGSNIACPGCFGYYVDEVSLEHHWQRFELRFRDLVQFDNGNPLVPLRPDTLVGLVFWPDRDFDIWLDDVRFEP
jgi:hypothetical protein